MIQPDFGEIQTTVQLSPTITSSSSTTSSSSDTSNSSSSSLVELAVVGGVVAVAMTAFLYFTSSSGSTKSKSKKKKKKKTLAQPNNSSSSSSRKNNNSSNKRKKKADATTSPKKVPTTATPVANNSVFKNLIAPAREIKASKPVCTIVAEWNVVEQLLLQADINNSVKAFMQALQKQRLNYATDKAEVAKRDMTGQAVIMKCIDFFCFENFELPKVVFAQAHNKFVKDIQRGLFKPADSNTKNPESHLLHVARFACSFCMNQVKDFANAEKLGWQSRSVRELNGIKKPPSGAMEFLRLMKETRETKKVLAQLYPRQAAKRMQQAATIAKAELEFVKYVHGVESEEYLNMLIEAGKLLLQLQPQTKKITEMSMKFLKEATEHALFEEKKSAEQKSQLIILVAMSSILSGKVDESLTYIFKGIDSYKEVLENTGNADDEEGTKEQKAGSTEIKKSAESNFKLAQRKNVKDMQQDRRYKFQQNFTFFILTLISSDKAEDALKVIEGVMRFPPLSGKYALNKVYVDDKLLLQQLYTYCKAIAEDSDTNKSLDERANIGGMALKKLCPNGGITIPTMKSRRFKKQEPANLTMYPEVYETLRFKSNRLLQMVESLYIQATNKYNRNEYLLSTNVCRIMFQLCKNGCANNEKTMKAVLAGLRDIMSKSAVAMVGEKEAEEVIEKACIETKAALEIQGVIDEKDSLTIRSRKLTKMLHFNNDLKVLYASTGKIELASHAFIKSSEAMMKIREESAKILKEAKEKKSPSVKKLQSSQILLKTVKDHAVKTLLHIFVWNENLTEQDVHDMYKIVEEAKKHMQVFLDEIDEADENYESKKKVVQQEIEDAKTSLTFVYEFGCVNNCAEIATNNLEMIEHVEASNHSKCVTTSKDPTSKVVWSTIASSSEYTKYQKHDAALRYLTFALKIAFHLYEKTRKSIYSQILKFWVTTLFQASNSRLKECGVTIEIGNKVAKILQENQLATAKTINEVITLIQKNCSNTEDNEQPAEEEKKSTIQSE